MKATKILFAAAVAALALVSCNKNGGKDPITLETPAFAQEAATIEFQDVHDELVIGGQAMTPERLIFTEDGDFLLIGKPLTKAGEARRFLMGTYNVKNGIYQLLDAAKKALASVALNGGTITITPDGGVTITFNGNVKQGKDSSEEAGYLCRNWVPGKIRVVVASKNVDHSFNPDFYEVASYLKEHKMDVNPDDYKGQKVTKMTFTKNGDFIIYFSGRDPFEGQWTWKSVKDLTFTYNFEANVGKEFFSGTSDGTLEFSGKKCEVAMNATVNGIKAIITFALTEE